MHLLLAQKGSIAEGDEAIDLGQTPGDVIFLSAADTELASLATAHQKSDAGVSLRLANMMQLSHPMSIDVYGDAIAAKARLVIVRCLGGESYWPYGLEKLHQVAVDNDVLLAVLPGDDKPDPSLDRFNTVAEDDRNALWAYLIAGGATNSELFLTYAGAMIGKGHKPGEPVPLLKAGLWWPDIAASDLAAIQNSWIENAPVVGITFYRALLQSGNLEPIGALIAALQDRGINPLPIFIASLKDEVSKETLRGIFADTSPSVVINCTGFAVSSPTGLRIPTVLEEGGAVVLQAVLAGGSEAAWADSDQGLSARDLAMNVALPEVDGRVLSRAIAFKNADNFDENTQTNIVKHQPIMDRVEFVADLAKSWAELSKRPENLRKIGMVLANYPNRDGRIGNGVGLDTPAGTIEVLRAMAAAGYNCGEIPADGDALIDHLLAGPTNASNDGRVIRETISLNDYNAFFATLAPQIQDEVSARWGGPQNDPYYIEKTDEFALPLARFGNVAIGIQPARGYNIDPKSSYHSPDLVPPHGYFAFYAWLRKCFEVDAIIHMGKHGNLEWLPGKALALSKACYPEAALGPIPHLYPFIVNDPGEGTQAKRRSAAVIIDHLTPPLTRAETYGPLAQLEVLVDEYYEASGVDPRRLAYLKGEILNLIKDIGLDQDAGIKASDDEGEALTKLDTYLCELKEMQIRDGLHIFGKSPEGMLKRDLVVALARVPRGLGEAGDQSLLRAMASDLRFDNFDPLDCVMGEPWNGQCPEIIGKISDDPWRSTGDTVERLELMAADLVSEEIECPRDWVNTRAVMAAIRDQILPAVETCGAAEINGILAGLDGRFVPPGPSGAPTRGRVDVLPTGRNFYSVDCRAVPTPAAWHLGQKSAELLIKRHRQEQGEWPQSFGISAWGTSNMRTGGDDIAQALALIGAKPVWEMASGRVTGYDIIPLATLGRPRVDVTFRISGFFRDAFPAQIELFDRAIRAVGALEEDANDNPIAARMTVERAQLIADGVSVDEAGLKSGHRIFGSKPGAYGAGLQALIDEKGWDNRGDLAEAYLAWGSYAYGVQSKGTKERQAFTSRLKSIDAVVHNQDNREHDLLDSDDYYQFEGGMTAAAEHVSGTRPIVYHNDHSRPDRPVIRTLEEEIGRVVRARVTNPKWINGVMRHGYKGAFEIAATVDYLFAFSATTGAVRDHHFDAVYQAFVVDDDVREFLADKNPNALRELSARLLEAQSRGLWTAKSNSSKFNLEKLSTGDSYDQ